MNGEANDRFRASGSQSRELTIVSPAREHGGMLSRTKIFLILFFLPAWIASLLQWGDDRTSSGFAAAPYWFYRVQLVTQFAAILLLFMPPRLRPRPSLPIVFFSIAALAGLYTASPILEAEFILINGSVLIIGIALFLAIARPGATLSRSDIALLFYMVSVGFALQIFLYFQFGIMPSHSSANLFVRFNGITNDSLASGFILPLFIPWAVNSRFSLIKVCVVVAEAVISGSMFAVVFVPTAALLYMLYQRRFRVAFAAVALALVILTRFYSFFSQILEIKLLSIVTHLRFFLNFSGTYLQQSKVSCSEEFCESFFESALYLSPVYMVAFYALMLCFILPLFQMRRADAPLMTDTLRIYGAALIVGTLVHPVPLIPFAVPLFLVLTCLFVGSDPKPGRTRLAVVPLS